MRAAGWVKLTVAFLLSGAMAAQVFALSEAQREAMIERIKPVGTVCVEGDAECAAVAATAKTPADARSGEEVYDASCMACHATGAGGSPLLGDTGAWAERLAKGKETLYENSINGIGGMPPMGACATCSEDELRAAVDYILENSQ